MARPVTLFTGQWADLPFETICQKAKSFGYEGIELASWGIISKLTKSCRTKGTSKRNGKSCWLMD